jgi:aminoglycoside 6'-N-acetyltransferase
MISLRAVRPSDLELLRRWDRQPHIIAARANGAWGDEREITRTPDWREQLISEHERRPIGFVQIIDPAREDSHYWGDVATDLRAVDIWIGEATDLGRGYGTEMIRLALIRCFSDPSVSAVLVDPLASNTRACQFFERAGFRFIERHRFGEDDCCVYRLDARRLP